MEKAFDKVWIEGLVNKLKNINISHKMLHWIKNYLKNRQALVKTNGIRSKTENLQNGVPQRGVLSPALFLIFINDIQKQISKKVYPSLYADDPALLCTEEEMGTAKIRLQTKLNGKASGHLTGDFQGTKQKQHTLFSPSQQKSAM